ncbi:MAG: diaminopimelate epimerase [Gammaproteobacteria bacterium]|nr:diaminopimelate epimerase [Gammaproteobacteria bacterium]
MQLKFTKMHALGNDFLVARGAETPSGGVIRALADRHTGVGFDQLLWLSEPDGTGVDVFYRIYNADGGEVEQCGNGARCIARYIAGDSADNERVWRLGFPGGVVNAQLMTDGNIAVEMAVPSFEPADLPFTTAERAATYTVNAGGTAVEFAAVSMGNPHAVIRVDDVTTAPVAHLGPLLEGHECFPNRANIGFMQVVGPAHIRLRVFERGVGETSACGTGACAAVAAGRQAGLLDEEVTVALPGGELRVRWPGEGAPVWLIGEAVRAFDGVVAI